ncbi:MAG: Wzz/FepE/Etk N-terminal domain-containing protein [Pseudomonadota bacterium]|nr:Wzz/FepE/Etk N-terminal domain-containing protein [Pseudomonadota bacterium]
MEEAPRNIDHTEYVDISVVGRLRVIRKHAILFAMFVCLSTSLGVAYAFLSTPKYKSTTLISPSSDGAQGNYVTSLLGGLGFGGMNMRQARNSRAMGLAALSSAFFTRAFIEENNLLPVFFSDIWDAENEEWLVDEPGDIPTLQEGYELFSNDIILVEDQGFNGLVNVSMTWKDPQMAADLANNIVASVNARLRDQAIGDADLTIQYLNEELAKTTAIELQQSLYNLIQTEIEKRTFAQVQKEYSFNVISPATPSDIDKWESPNRVFSICVGFMMGIFLGVLFAFLFEPTKRVLRESEL